MENTLPEKFLERLEQIVPKNKYGEVLAALEKEPLPSFRVNTLISNTEDAVKELEKEGFLLEQVEWYRDAFLVKNRSIRELTDTDLYKNGKLYIQNLSSMLPSLILDPRPGEKILDMAAAPGSKTTHIATLMQNTGEIVANDISRQRLYRLKDNLRSQDVSIAKLINFPGQMLWKRFPHYFDKVLVDAPCSMEGLIRTTNEKSYTDWSTKKIKMLSELQKHLLRSAVVTAKPGGLILYSTCTLSPEENEGVIDWLLKKDGSTVKLEDIHSFGAPFIQGKTTWNIHEFDPSLEKTKRILPSQTMEGFFVALLRKRSFED